MISCPAGLHRALRVVAIFALFLLVVVRPFATRADSQPTTITVTTSSLSGTTADIAFDFLDGGPPSNSVLLSDFSTNGSFLGSSGSGSVSGSFPGTVTLNDSSFFSEYLATVTLGGSFSFVFTATTNGPGSGSLPDAFSLFLLDPSTGLPLFSTNDPTESDSLLLLNIDGSSQGALSLYQASDGQVVVSASSGSQPGGPQPIPEPPSVEMLAGGVLLVLVGSKLKGSFGLVR